jgi:hypothetical protein
MEQASLNRLQSIWRGRTPQFVAAVTLLAVTSLFPVNAKAACRVSSGSRSDISMPLDLLEHAPAEPSGQASTQHSSEAPLNSSAHESRPSITGLWFVTFYSEGVAFDQGFDIWHSDGTEILNDNGPPEPAWSTGSFCMGVWKLTGYNTYKLKHVGWNFDGNGNLSARLVILQTVTVNAPGNRYEGSLELDLYDPVSGNLMSQTIGEVKAHRIQVD